jgi:hypothetical protein
VARMTGKHHHALVFLLVVMGSHKRFARAVLKPLSSQSCLQRS